jgi:glycosyltransferase involved in cell wall biosynthesis
MLHVDVGNTLRGGLRTGIQRVVRSLAYDLASKAPDSTRLIAFDPAAERYFALADPELIRSADSLADLKAEDRIYFPFHTFAQGDIYFEPDSTWSEPLNRGALFRQLKAKGVIVVILNHDAIPVLLPEVCHPNTLISFSEAIADHLQYADYALTTSQGVDRDLKALSLRFLGRSMATRVVGLGADFEALAPEEAQPSTATAAAFPELAGQRYLLSVGTIEPRKNHALLLKAFDRLEAKDAGLVIVGRQGWMADDLLAALKTHPDYGKRLFWYTAIDDDALLALYRNAHASVLPSHYEGYGLPAVEALTQGCATIVSNTGSLPEVTGGHAAIFPGGDGEALYAILDRLYRDPAYHSELKDKARSFRPISWREASTAAKAALDGIRSGASHGFDQPVRQIVYLSTNPEILDLSLRSVRDHLSFIDRVVVLTKPERKAAIEAIARRHFADAVVLADDEVTEASLPSDHQARNTWLRKNLYRHDAIEPNFLSADEDYLALRPLDRGDFQNGSRHTGYNFLEDMGGWLAGSPTATSYDRGIRNAWRLLAKAAYPTRGFASHMPQIVNKSLVNEIYDRFIPAADAAALDEWSLYFNVAMQLYPRHFEAKPYKTLGWPMRTGDWFPEIAPAAPAFENYYPQSYAPGGPFNGLGPLGDLDAKIARMRQGIANATRIEREGGGEHVPSPFALIVTEDGLRFVGDGTVVAGKRNVRRILLINGAKGEAPIKGKLDMFLTEPRGTPGGGESVALGEVTWMPLLPPEKPGLYPIRFFATLKNGSRIGTRGLLTVIEDRKPQ